MVVAGINRAGRQGEGRERKDLLDANFAESLRSSCATRLARSHHSSPTLPPPRLTARTLAKAEAKLASKSSGIESWAATSTQGSLPETMDTPPEGRLDWPDFVAQARITLINGKLIARSALFEELLGLAKKRESTSCLVHHLLELTCLLLSPATLEPSQAQDIIRLLILTVPRFVDGMSRQAVLSILQALLSREHSTSHDDSQPEGNGKPSGISGGMIKWVESEVAKLEKGGTTGTRFVVLTWACAVYASISDGEPLAEAQWTSIVGSLSSLVEMLLDGAQGLRPSLRKAVLTSTRRTVRNVCRGSWAPCGVRTDLL